MFNGMRRTNSTTSTDTIYFDAVSNLDGESTDIVDSEKYIQHNVEDTQLELDPKEDLDRSLAIYNETLATDESIDTEAENVLAETGSSRIDGPYLFIEIVISVALYIKQFFGSLYNRTNSLVFNVQRLLWIID